MYIYSIKHKRISIFIFNSPLKTHQQRPPKSAFSNQPKMGEGISSKNGGSWGGE